jgi:hypothetical protein
MIPTGMTERTRAETALASQAARHSWWPAGTLAAAGTIPARTMNAYATFVFSQGHHPANHRSAIPARAYESGSGHGHDAAPAGHPHPPRPPPAGSPPPGPALIAPVSAPACPPQGRLRRRRASAPRPSTQASRRTAGQLSAPGLRFPCPQTRTQPVTKTHKPSQTIPGQLQSLDEPLHMSAQPGQLVFPHESRD